MTTLHKSAGNYDKTRCKRRDRGSEDRVASLDESHPGVTPFVRGWRVCTSRQVGTQAVTERASMRSRREMFRGRQLPDPRPLKFPPSLRGDLEDIITYIVGFSLDGGGRKY